MTNTTINIPGYEGRAVLIEQENTFRVIDVEGCQMADLLFIAANNKNEVFSPAMTRLVGFKLTAKPGDVIYSNHRRPMLTFLNDTSPGLHDMSFAPCDPEFYVDLGADSAHPNCRDNFYKAIQQMDIKIEPPPDPFNLFQNTTPKTNGDFNCAQTLSKAGDYVEFKTEMDVIIVVTACSADLPIEGVEPIGGVSTSLCIQLL